MPCAGLDTDAYLQRLEESAALGALTDRHIAQQLQRGSRIVSSLQQVRGLLLPSLSPFCNAAGASNQVQKTTPPATSGSSCSAAQTSCPVASRCAGAPLPDRLFSRQRQPASDRIR